MMNNEKLNNLVLDYQRTRNEDVFEQIYAAVSTSWRRLDTIGKSVMADGAEVLAGYEDTLLKCIETFDNRVDFAKLLSRSIRNKRGDIYRKKKRIYQNEQFIAPVENEDGSEVAFEIEDEFNLEEYITAKKKADQRQLISSLLSDADAKTTAIVEAFLTNEKPTPTAIGEALGLHHSTVIRSLKRLAGKFDSKKYGDYTDFLVAL
jgi:DNA-directed RNA polymerase specialized sigma24 family protein